MSREAVATLRQVLRGAEPNELHLLDSEGKITILSGYGLTVDEQIRTRETAIRLIRTVLSPDPIAEIDASRVR